MSKLTASAKSTPWIYNPALDLIVGCGAWSAPLLLVSYFAIASSARTWSIVFYLLAFFFNYPHYMATIYRAYHRAEDFQKYRVFTVHITALVLATLVLSHAWLRILPWIFTIYLTWSPWHYSGQNYGLFMMFARRAGANPSKGTRRVLYSAFIVSYLILFLSFHTGPSTDSLFVSLGIPAVVSRWEQVFLGVAFVALSTYGLAKLAKETGWRNLIPPLTLFSSQFLWFLLPSAISLIKGLAVPQNRYSSGVLAVMHSAQYLWITSYYARREATSESAAQPRSWRPFAYFAVLVIGGIALFVPGPWLASRAFHHDFTASFLIFTALVNIHHFILDGAVWKLRDGRIASFLLQSRERLADAATGAGGRISQAGQWLTGSTPAARSLRLSAAVLLLVWGTVDQARHYLALRTDDLSALERAERLNAFDSSLDMHLASRALEVGKSAQAEAYWRRAMQSNPADPGPRQALLQFLIEESRYDEAMTLTETALRYSPRDPNLLINRGLLAMNGGHPEQASADWRRALEIDPNQVNAQLYLAGELDKTGQAQAAASHYNAYLTKIAHQSAQNRPNPEQLIAVVLRMADCQARSSQLPLAEKSYQMAEALAIQTQQPKLQSVAENNAAALEAKAGKISEALRLYQQAIEVDRKTADNRAAADDWLAYARFLDTFGFSPRLVYASLLQSEALAKTFSTEPDETLKSAKKAVEKRLGPEASVLQHDPEPALREALALRHE